MWKDSKLLDEKGKLWDNVKVGIKKRIEVGMMVRKNMNNSPFIKPETQNKNLSKIRTRIRKQKRRQKRKMEDFQIADITRPWYWAGEIRGEKECSRRAWREARRLVDE